MKKILKSLFCALAFASAVVMPAYSGESAGQENPGEEFSQIVFGPQGGKVLDAWWELYFQTQDTGSLKPIIDCADSDDTMLALINENYARVKKDKAVTTFLKKELGMKVKGKKFLCKYDTETAICKLLRSDDHKNVIQTLFSYFPDESVVKAVFRGAVKGSAYWSLVSNAEQHEAVRDYLKEQFPSLKEKTRDTFTTYFDYEWE